MQAVILTAIADACGTPNGRPANRVAADKRAALTWFEDAGPDFERVCDLAGLHPQTVRKFALAFIQSGKPFPRIPRQNHCGRNRNPVSPATIAARARVSVAAVRGVLKHDRGSSELKCLVRTTLQDLAQEQRMAA